MSWVRQKIGMQAGAIIEMPQHVAEMCVSSGTAEFATEQDLKDAGLGATEVLIPSENELLAGYRIQDGENGGFDLLDAGGVILNPVDKPFHNYIAAREFAIRYSAASRQVPVPEGAAKVPTVDVPDDWQDMHQATIRKLAKDISGADALPSLSDAKVTIEGALAQQAPEADAKVAKPKGKGGEE